MSEIHVVEKGENVFEVVVEAASRTVHQVRVDPDYAARIAPEIPPAELVRRSFAFLLEREPNTSILRSFDLPVIARYFPEFESVIATGSSS